MSETAKQYRYRLNHGLGNWKFIGNGHIRGYAGLTHTALMISEYIPNCIKYVEPFAGLGRFAKYVTCGVLVLNDLSDYANNHNKKFQF